MYSGGINFAQCMSVTLKKRSSKIKKARGFVAKSKKIAKRAQPKKKTPTRLGIEQIQNYRRKNYERFRSSQTRSSKGERIVSREATGSLDQNKRKELFDKIDTELEIHAHIEETVFYPALETHEELKDMVAEALEEHQEVEIMLEELEELGSESHDFGSKLQELIESVEHHVEEEEGEMFPKVREVFDEGQLEQLGQELESAKGTAHRKAG